MPQLKPITLTTERLTLRWMTNNDVDAQYALFSDPAITRYWSSPAWTDIAQARAYVEKTIAEYKDSSGLRFAVVLQATGEMIGSVKLYDFDDANRRCAVGYALQQSYWGKGFVSEAMTAVLRHAFEEFNMNRIEADVDPRNDASAKVLERQGFVKEGFLRERWIVNNEICDTAFYGLLRRDWTPR